MLVDDDWLGGCSVGAAELLDVLASAAPACAIAALVRSDAAIDESIAGSSLKILRRAPNAFTPIAVRSASDCN